MSFSAMLYVAGASIPVNHAHLEVAQATDPKGRPISASRGGTITLEFDTESIELIADWMINPIKKHNGSIVFKNYDQNSLMKQISFENGYCVEMCLDFDGTASSKGMTTVIRISSEKVQVGSAALDNKWPSN